MDVRTDDRPSMPAGSQPVPAWGFNGTAPPWEGLWVASLLKSNP